MEHEKILELLLITYNESEASVIINKKVNDTLWYDDVETLFEAFARVIEKETKGRIQ